MKYLRKFETDVDVQDWQMSEGYVKPNVVLVGDIGVVNYNVKPLSGVMIQHIDGSLYTTDEWTAGGFAESEANGVAVIGVNAKFVIAKTSLDDMVWSSDINAVEGVMLKDVVDIVKTDYAGEANTALIAAIDTDGAAYSCANFTFPNGAKGYLPALGEWFEAHKYKADIDAAITLIGGTAFISSTINGLNYYWSSTQYSADKAWLFNWREGDCGGREKNTSTSNHVRAFSAL